MTRFVAAALISLIAVPTATAFAPEFLSRPKIQTSVAAISDDETDFDAPFLNNPVRAGAPGELDHDIVVDDECYLGKYGQYPECVDFDPMHNADANTKAEFEMPDFSKLGEELTAMIKDSPLGKLLNSK